MPFKLTQGRATVLIRREPFEKSGIVRSAIDQRYNLTDQEFQAAEGLIAIGPLPSDDLLPDLIADLEGSGLAYYDDFFEMSGNWPEWLGIHVRNS
ncbi:MAG TPA: hypothetical protein VNJ04_19095 [Gemmatimonadaceae bacterium]|nr:hypothetical protein [Gemmatimonadaceae bacterium]